MDTNRTRADYMDRTNQIMAWDAVVLGVMIGLDSVAGFVGETIAGYLEVIGMAAAGLLLVALVWLVLLIVRKLTASRESGTTLRIDDFTSELVRKACVSSWGFTLIVTFFLDNDFLGMPAVSPVESITGLVMAVMLLSYGIAFVFFDWRMNYAGRGDGGYDHEC